MDKKQLGNAAGKGRAEGCLEYLTGSQPSTCDLITVRAARVKLIEQTCLKLTDQLTVIHGQAQILSEKLPANLRGYAANPQCSHERNGVQQACA